MAAAPLESVEPAPAAAAAAPLDLGGTHPGGEACTGNATGWTQAPLAAAAAAGPPPPHKLAAAPPLATHKKAAASPWRCQRAMLPWLTRFESVGWVDSAQANALCLSGRGTGVLVDQRNSMDNCMSIHFGIVGVGA